MPQNKSTLPKATAQGHTTQKQASNSQVATAFMCNTNKETNKAAMHELSPKPQLPAVRPHRSQARPATRGTKHSRRMQSLAPSKNGGGSNPRRLQNRSYRTEATLQLAAAWHGYPRLAPAEPLERCNRLVPGQLTNPRNCTRKRAPSIPAIGKRSQHHCAALA